MRRQFILRGCCVAAAFALAGCSEEAVQTVVGIDGVRVDVTHGSFDKCQPDAGGKDASGTPRAWKTRDTSFSIEQGHLTVDGRDYGEVMGGDHVQIQAGNVLVNGDQRKPATP